MGEKEMSFHIPGMTVVWEEIHKYFGDRVEQTNPHSAFATLDVVFRMQDCTTVEQLREVMVIVVRRHDAGMFDEVCQEIIREEHDKAKQRTAGKGVVA